jgi:hypothetical protein
MPLWQLQASLLRRRSQRRLLLLPFRLTTRPNQAFRQQPSVTYRVETTTYSDVAGRRAATKDLVAGLT